MHKKYSQSKLAQLPDKLLHLLGAETGGGPVERGREVVGEPLAGNLGVDAVGELLGLGVDGGLGLHPDEVGVGGKGDGTVDRALGAALVAEVALPVSTIRIKMLLQAQKRRWRYVEAGVEAEVEVEVGWRQGRDPDHVAGAGSTAGK